MIAKWEQLNISAHSSTRHHYIPIFYLQRWHGTDRRLCEFSRPYKRIYTKRIYPVQTGFVDRLYEMKGVPSAMAQQVEEEFMKPVDSLAARSLSMLETQNERINHDPKYRSAWSLFLMTLLMRMPEDLEVLAAALADEWARDFLSWRKNTQSRGRPTIHQHCRNSSIKKTPIICRDGHWIWPAG